jgi:hypothetical protein
LFKKVFEYAGEYHTKTYEVIAVMFMGLVASVVPFFLAYRITRPLLMRETLVVGTAAAITAVIAVYGVFHAPLKSFYSQSPWLTAMNSCLDRLEAVFARKPLSNEGKDRIPSQGGTVAQQGSIYRDFVTARESSRGWSRRKAAD